LAPVSVDAQSVIKPRRRAHGVAHQLRVLAVVAAIDFKLRYADSALGYLWSLLKPLAMFSVLYAVFGRFFKLNAGLSHYPLYLLIGVVLWTFFLDATTMTLPSIVYRGELLRKLAFPRIIVPVSSTLTAGLTFAVNLLAIAAFVAGNRIVPSPRWLLLLPLLAELYLFTLGLGLLLSALFVSFRDIGQIWELVAQLLFYATPTFYPVSLLPHWMQSVVFLNPFVQVMQDVRSIVLASDPVTTAPQVYGTWAGELAPVAITAVVFAIGFGIFRRRSPWFAEKV
jgi:ABC-2 type transport system permease protein